MSEKRFWSLVVEEDAGIGLVEKDSDAGVNAEAVVARVASTSSTSRNDFIVLQVIIPEM